jgi:ribosomal protein L16 Arg81 hydroxylase
MIKVKRNFDNKVLSWKEILDELWKAFYENQYIKFNAPAFFSTPSANHIKKVKRILKKLKLKEAHLYISLTHDSCSFGRHNDDSDVYFWQQQGSTLWKFDNKKPIILKKGDLIYIPKGVHHDVTSLAPRAGLSMGL